MSGALSPVGVQVNNGPIIYPAGLWTPATTGTFPDTYVHGAPAYDPISRVGGNAADTLNGEDFGILSVTVSNGG